MRSLSCVMEFRDFYEFISYQMLEWKLELMEDPRRWPWQKKKARRIQEQKDYTSKMKDKKM